MSTDFPLRNDEALEETVAPPTDEETFIEDGVLYVEEVTPEYGILGFTLRELLIVGVWLLHFVFSFFPLVASSSLWSTGIEWVLPVGLPTVAVFLLVLRRFSPDGIRRVGSLGIDQFASVSFAVAATVLVGKLWLAIAGVIGSGFWVLNWSGVVLVVTSLALVALTVFAPIIPGLKEDFQGRLVTLAHRAANPVRPVIARPRPERPEHPVDAPAPASAPASAPLDAELSGVHATDEIARDDLAAQVPLSAHASGGDVGTEQVVSDEDYRPAYSRRSSSEEIAYDTASIVELVTPQTDAIEPITGLASAESVAVEPASADSEVSEQTTVHQIVEPASESSGAEPAVAEVDVEATHPRAAVAEPQPFWILAPTEREVHDERGDVIFQIGPTAWALVIEDRGGAFVVRHDDGRIGYLHDISDITKG